MSKKTLIFLGVCAVGGLLGLIYSGYSTADFVAHLDRQLHPVNCSLLPGITATSQLDKEAEGCKVAMFSPYSSMWRDRYWGGIPISLFAIGLFGFALAISIWGMVTRRGHQMAPGIFLLFAGLVAIAASIVYFGISVSKLHTTCTTCVGTYIASALLLVGAILAFLSGRADRRVAKDGEEGSVGLAMIVLTVEMGLAVFLPVMIYLSVLPNYDKHVTSCESLKTREDKNNVLISLGSPKGTNEVILVTDPLCPTCKALHRRIEASSFASGLSYKMQLLPLDAECNWMLKDSLHPGACLLSRGLLCAGARAEEMLNFIYDQQDTFRNDGLRKEVDRISEKLLAQFPEVRECMASPDTQIRLNKALHFAVANSLPLSTPQMYLNGKRLCDEDTDLGLEYALTKLLGK